MIQEKELNAKEFSVRKTTLTYPCFQIQVGEVTPQVINLLEEGEIPLVGFYKGKNAILKRISLSAYNVSRLLRTHGEVNYKKSSGEECMVKSVEAYLEVL